MNHDWSVTRSSVSDLSAYFGNGLRLHAEGWYGVEEDTMLVLKLAADIWCAYVWTGRDPREEIQRILKLKDHGRH